MERMSSYHLFDGWGKSLPLAVLSLLTISMVAAHPIPTDHENVVIEGKTLNDDGTWWQQGLDSVLSRNTQRMAGAKLTIAKIKGDVIAEAVAEAGAKAFDAVTNVDPVEALSGVEESIVAGKTDAIHAVFGAKKQLVRHVSDAEYTKAIADVANATVAHINKAIAATSSTVSATKSTLADYADTLTSTGVGSAKSVVADAVRIAVGAIEDASSAVLATLADTKDRLAAFVTLTPGDGADGVGSTPAGDGVGDEVDDGGVDGDGSVGSGSDDSEGGIDIDIGVGDDGGDSTSGSGSGSTGLLTAKKQLISTVAGEARLKVLDAVDKLVSVVGELPDQFNDILLQLIRLKSDAKSGVKEVVFNAKKIVGNKVSAVKGGIVDAPRDLEDLGDVKIDAKDEMMADLQAAAVPAVPEVVIDPLLRFPLFNDDEGLTVTESIVESDVDDVDGDDIEKLIEKAEASVSQPRSGRAAGSVEDVVHERARGQGQPKVNDAKQRKRQRQTPQDRLRACLATQMAEHTPTEHKAYCIAVYSRQTYAKAHHRQRQN